MEDGFDDSSPIGEIRSKIAGDHDGCTDGRCFKDVKIMCDRDAYVARFGAKVERAYSWYDDIGVGDIRLHCRGLLGEWGGKPETGKDLPGLW